MGWPLCIVSFRLASLCSAMRATLNGGGDSSEAMATASIRSVQHQHRPQHQMLHLHTGTRRVGRRSDAAQETSLSAHHRLQLSSAQPAAKASSQRPPSAGRRALRPRGATLLEPLVRCTPPGHMTEPVRPSFNPTAAAVSHTPILHFPPCIAVAKARLLLAVRGAIVLRPTTARRRLPLLKRTHPDAGLHTPCYSCPTHTLTRPPSRCTTTPHVATLGSRALLQIHPPFRQTCLLASIAKHCSPPLLRFRALRIPSSPSSHIGFARLHVHKRLLVLHFASLHLATSTLSRAPLIDLVTATWSSFEHP